MASAPVSSARKMTFGSLFAGIGGMDLGLERAGMECRWQVEIDPFCRKVLTKHWPDVPKYEDVRDVGAELESVDLICGGFPCQDLSIGNQGGAGLRGERSGLWHSFQRVVEELRPQWVLVENVHHTWRRWVPTVRVHLASIGYASLPLRLSAAEVGADHHRARAFVLANTHRASIWDLPGRWSGEDGEVATEPLDARWGTAASRVARSDDGVPDRVDRLRSLGNAVVPQVAEWIGRRILETGASR